MKVLNLILASNGTAYKPYEEQWLRYMNSNPQIESYFYKARGDIKGDYELSGNTLWIRMGDCMGNVYAKTLKALAFFRPRFAEFDFILRPNMSSMFLFDRYLKYLETLPTEKCVEGVYIHSHGYTYPSGCGFTITPDFAEILIDTNQLQYHMDDVTVGKVAKENGVVVKTRDFLCVRPENVEVAIKTLQDKPGLFHLRFKTENRLKDAEAYGTVLSEFMNAEVPEDVLQQQDPAYVSPLLRKLIVSHQQLKHL
jgi:hypothetical protein